MSEQQQGPDTKADQPSTKNGEESFTEEIKDYAKTTMNELLGMFGYDDEITSESVNNLEIKVPSTAEEPATANPVISTVPSVTAVTVTTSSTVTPSLPLNVPEDTSDDAPVIVKVEGNTSVNDIIRQQQNGDSSISNGATPVQVTSTNQTIPVTIPNTTQSTPMNITMTTQSQTGQPTLAPHFYAVPPAIRGVYCVVANLPLVVNQNKSAMTFKFWNCITCSEYFLEKPEVVFRVHYPHLFNGQPEWLYQAAVCLKCYHQLVTTVVPQTTTIPASLAQATFTVIDCKMEEQGKDNSTTTVYTTASINSKDVVLDSEKERKSTETNGNPPLINENNDKDLIDSDNVKPTDVSNGNESFVKDINGNPAPLKGNHVSISTPKGIPSSQVSQGSYISIESLTGNPSSQGNHSSKGSPRGDSPCASSPNPEQDTETQEENSLDNDELYKCYVCNLSVSVTSQHGKLRRSKFPSLFIDVPDNVGHFKVCQGCFDHLNHQREVYIKADIPDDKRDYRTKSDAASKSSDICFICEATLDDREPSRPIYRSRYPSLFRGLPGHMIHVPICDKCYKKLQKVKLRFDSGQHEEDTRNYVQFVNMWRAKRGLGKHPVFV